jgi:hypothetical protein
MAGASFPQASDGLDRRPSLRCRHRRQVCGQGSSQRCEVPVAPDRGDALAGSGGSANAIAFPSGSGTFTWRTPFE